MSRMNPLLGKKSKEERRASISQSLMASAIPNISPEYHLPPQNSNQPQSKIIAVTLDKLRPFEGNPRKTKNPMYNEIKASIKARGLDHAPNITQRPGDDFYTIADGGNTRLQALRELFEETQDPRFWSIECVFKPWEGDANSTDAKLNQLIGHLAENDIRGELSFIEKALGIQQVKSLYEEKYGEKFSHLKLSQKLGENGYPISQQIISRMDQCLTYLYPYIPNILLSGLGKPQIEKILSVKRNAETAWQQHCLAIEPLTTFDECWQIALSSFDEEPDEFSLPIFQDSLITQIAEAFGCQIDYDTLKIEIDLEERKLKKMMEKQSEIIQRALESEYRLQEIKQEEAEKQAKLTERAEKNNQAVPTNENYAEPAKQSETTDIEIEEQDEEYRADVTFSDNVNLPTFKADDEVTESVLSHFADLGLVPGINSEVQRSEQAVENGLAFADTGRQPISHIWKIYPNRQHKMEAFSIALDIAEEFGIDHLIQHIVKEPVDYSFTVLPLTEGDDLTRSIHQLLTTLSTAENEQSQKMALHLSALSADISDLALVRIFRLIRLVRYINEQAQGEQNA